MDESIKNSPCKECNDGEGLQLHAEVDHLRQHLSERDAHIVALEGEFIKCTARANNFEEQLNTWREKYERLYDSHKRVQKLNQVLEDKLLQMVDKMKSEKSQLTKDIATLSVRLAESKHNYSMLHKENERYKNDMNLAIQLLQCKPDNFVSHKLDNLPVDTQARVSQYVMSKTSKPSSSTQSRTGNEVETFDASEYEFNISASLMTKILEDSIQDTVTKHCDTCTCNKTKNKPFCYNDSHYTVSTQTVLSGEMTKSCLNCNGDVKSLHSNLSIKSTSSIPYKVVTEESTKHNLNVPLYVLPQNPDMYTHNDAVIIEETGGNSVDSDKFKIDGKSVTSMTEVIAQKEVSICVDDVKVIKNNNEMHIEPAVHHKLCDRTKSISSKKSSIHSAGHEDLLVIKDNIPLNIEIPSKTENKSLDNANIRKNSHSSMGAISRTSSIAKSTVSAQKLNTQVGPGPRFCHLRMQAGSKNILLDNVEPDVPPILYTRQSKCNENSLFKDLHDDADNFIDLNKNNGKEIQKIDNLVVESTLIDVHVDNNNKENVITKNTTINPILLNVSSSPLQPMKTHNFSSTSENNNNQSQSSQQNIAEINNLLNDFNVDVNNTQNDIHETDDKDKNSDEITPSDTHDVKIFNFDRYEQKKLSNQFNKSLRKIDMSQLHSLENTKISKDLPPQGDASEVEKKPETKKAALPPIVNVYPNLTQTHLKANETRKAFTNEHSTSSLSSDDSAALLQKQQLLRVAEWVEKNLEQHNNFNDPLEEDGATSNRAGKRETNLSRLTETLNELALNMPHPVSKYSKAFLKESQKAMVHNKLSTNEKIKKTASPNTVIVSNIVKETIFPVEIGGPTTEICKDNSKNKTNVDEYAKELKRSFKKEVNKDISPEDLARMEYNVKKFLLSGPHWVNPASDARSRRTSSKTETDV